MPPSLAFVRCFALLRKTAALKLNEQVFVAASWATAPAMVASLRLLGLRRTLRWVSVMSQVGGPLGHPVPNARAAALVRAVFRHHLVTPGCLPESLVQYLLQRRAGARVVLRVGVRRDGNTGLDAHAWVCDATTSDESDARGYAVLYEVTSS